MRCLYAKGNTNLRKKPAIQHRSVPGNCGTVDDASSVFSPSTYFSRRPAYTYWAQDLEEADQSQCIPGLETLSTSSTTRVSLYDLVKDATDLEEKTRRSQFSAFPKTTIHSRSNPHLFLVYQTAPSEGSFDLSHYSNTLTTTSLDPPRGHSASRLTAHIQALHTLRP